MGLVGKVGFGKSGFRLHLEWDVLEQVSEAKLLGIILREEQSRKSNTNYLIERAYKCMIILKKLFFDVPTSDLVDIYNLYIRSVLE